MPHKTQEAGEGVAVVWGVSHTEDICHPWSQGTVSLVTVTTTIASLMSNAPPACGRKSLDWLKEMSWKSLLPQRAPSVD